MFVFSFYLVYAWVYSWSSVKELPTLYWLLKLHKRPNKSRFIAIIAHVLLLSCRQFYFSLKYCETVFERNGKNLFWSIKISGEILSKLNYGA